MNAPLTWFFSSPCKGEVGCEAAGRGSLRANAIDPHPALPLLEGGMLLRTPR